MAESFETPTEILFPRILNTSNMKSCPTNAINGYLFDVCITVPATLRGVKP